jgi:hypothetical protein
MPILLFLDDKTDLTTRATVAPAANEAAARSSDDEVLLLDDDALDGILIQLFNCLLERCRSSAAAAVAVSVSV